MTVLHLTLTKFTISQSQPLEILRYHVTDLTRLRCHAQIWVRYIPNRDTNPGSTKLAQYATEGSITYHYYIVSSVSGQDEPNRALWLATRAGKIRLSCPLGTTRRVPREKFSPTRWLDIGLVLFLRVYGLRLRHATEKSTWPISRKPSWPHT